MRTGKGQKEHLKTVLPNGWTVSTKKIGGVWETMVFDPAGDEARVETNKYKNEAVHTHNFNVFRYVSA